MSEDVTFNFLARGLAAILGAGAVLMALVSVTTGPFGGGISGEAGGFAWAFFIGAIVIGLLSILAGKGEEVEGW